MLIGVEIADGLATGALAAAASTARRLCRLYRVTFLGDRFSEGLSRLRAVDFNLTRGEINLDFGLRVNRLDRVGDCAFAVAAGHSLYVQNLLHDDSL